jgi:hypothetical protein
MRKSIGGLIRTEEEFLLEEGDNLLKKVEVKIII